MKCEHLTDQAMRLVQDVNRAMRDLSDDELQSPLARAVAALVYDHILEGHPVDRAAEYAGTNVQILRRRGGQ